VIYLDLNYNIQFDGGIIYVIYLDLNYNIQFDGGIIYVIYLDLNYNIQFVDSYGLEGLSRTYRQDTTRQYR
jgi:hypothetical protein